MVKENLYIAMVVFLQDNFIKIKEFKGNIQQKRLLLKDNLKMIYFLMVKFYIKMEIPIKVHLIKMNRKIEVKR